MKNIFLTFVCLTFFISCDKEGKLNDKFISKFNYPPNKNIINRNDFYVFYICLDNGKSTYLPNKYLHELFLEKYIKTYPSYKSFLMEIFKNKLCLNEEFINYRPKYPIIKDILEYNKEELIEKFNLYEDENHLIFMNNSNLDRETIHNIAYSLFKKRHMIFFNEQAGLTIASPAHSR